MAKNQESINLVFDIGKTNKKALYYNLELFLLGKRSKQIDVLKEDGLEYEDIDSIKEWLFDEIKIATKNYKVLGIAISCHGGTFALLDNTNQLSQPILSYTSEVVSENQTSFFEQYGSVQDLQNITSSPDLGFVNIGKQVHFIKKNFPSVWNKTTSFIFYPQYLGFLLTGNKSMEVTILGNHSYMWDFQENKYSHFTRDSVLIEKAADSIQKPFEILGNIDDETKDKFQLSYDIPVTIGIHDSNASILPYLLKENNEFTLLSTGTWCVGLKPNQPYHLSKEDLETKTFYNLDAFGNPLRTSISPIGFEYEEYLKIINQKDPNILLDSERLTNSAIYVIPGILESTSIFADSQPGVMIKDQWLPFKEIKADPRLLDSIKPDEFFMALNASLAIQTAELLNRLNTNENECVYFEGGFAKNQTYLSCLQSLRPLLNFQRTNLEEATAYGAALTLAMSQDNYHEETLKKLIRIESNSINFNNNNTTIELYSNQFFNILGDQHASATRSN